MEKDNYYFKNENARPRKEEVEKIVISQNWKFTQLITGLSIGILAFSIQSLLKMKDLELNQDANFEYTWSLITSLILLLSAFVSGLGRLHYLRKDIQINYNYLADLIKTNNIGKKEVLESEHDKNRERIKCKNDVCSNIMSYSFLLGILFYTGFLISNICLVITN